MATPYGQQLASGGGETGAAAYARAGRAQSAARKAAAPKGRGGTTVAAGAFNQAHPRTAKGRVGGGQFAKKTQTQAQLRKQQAANRPPTTGEMLKAAGVKSIAEFQKTRGLPVTGKLDQRTVVALRNAHTAHQVDLQNQALKGSTKAAAATPGVVKLGKNEYAKIGMGTKDKPDARVKRIQQMLEHLGYDVAVDGVFGTETEAAVKLFQEGHSLPPTGVVTVQSMRRINTRQAEIDSGKSRTGFLTADEPVTRKGGKRLGGSGSTGRVSSKSKSPPKIRQTTVIMQAESDPAPVNPDKVVVDGEEIIGPDVRTLPWWNDDDLGVPDVDMDEPVEEAVWDRLLHPRGRGGLFRKTYRSKHGPVLTKRAKTYVVMPIPLAYQSREIGNPRTRTKGPSAAQVAPLQAKLGDAMAEGLKPGRESTSIYEVSNHMASAHTWPRLPDNFRIIEEAEVGGHDPTGGTLGMLSAKTSETEPPEWTVSVQSQTLDDGYGGLIYAHEMGHALDAAMAHEKMDYIPVPGMLMMSTIAANEPTALDAQFIRPEQRMAWRKFFKTAMTRSVGLHPSNQEYTASPHELWARAYAQWLYTTMPESARVEFENQSGAVHRWPPQEWEPVGKAVEGVLRAHHLLPTGDQAWKVSRDEPKSIKMVRIPQPRGANDDWTADARATVEDTIADIQAGIDTADALELNGFEREDATSWVLDTGDGLIYAEYDEDRPQDLMFEWDAFDRDYTFQPEAIFLNPDDQPEHRRWGLPVKEAEAPVPVSRAAEKLLGLVGRRLNGEPVTEYDRQVQMGLTAETVREAVALTLGGPDER